MTEVKFAEIGNPVLRENCREVSKNELKNPEIRKIIKKLREMVASANYGVGISANQIGEAVRISMIAIKPTPLRPTRKKFEKLLVNPEIVETFGRKIGVWEGCLSCGRDENTLFGRVPRYKKVRVKFMNENGETEEVLLENLAAHVIQHEIDHLNGMFFTDKVSRKSLMMANEYKKRIVGTKFANYYERSEINAVV